MYPRPTATLHRREPETVTTKKTRWTPDADSDLRSATSFVVMARIDLATDDEPDASIRCAMHALCDAYAALIFDDDELASTVPLFLEDIKKRLNREGA